MNKLIILCPLLWLISGCGEDKASDKNTKDTEILSAEAKDTVISHRASDVENDAAASTLNEPHQQDYMAVVEVKPDASQTLHAPVSGYVRNLRKLPGAKVSAGESLMLIESPDFVQMQEDYLVISAELRYAQAEFERNLSLYQSESISDREYGKSRMEYERLKARQGGVGQRLRLAGIDPSNLTPESINPFVVIRPRSNGTIGELMVGNGELVTPEDPLFRVMDGNRLQLMIRAHPHLADDLVPGSEFDCWHPGDSRVVKGTVISINDVANEENQMVSVIGEIDPASMPISVGEKLVVRF